MELNLWSYISQDHTRMTTRKQVRDILSSFSLHVLVSNTLYLEEIYIVVYPKLFLESREYLTRCSHVQRGDLSITTLKPKLIYSSGIYG
jgi:hypothetical protein